jgi:hypothetical protein
MLDGGQQELLAPPSKNTRARSISELDMALGWMDLESRIYSWNI